MGLFKRSNSVSSQSSAASDAGSTASSMSAKGKVKAGDLQFKTTASPNSRLLFLDEGAPIPRTTSTSSASSARSSGTTTRAAPAAAASAGRGERIGANGTATGNGRQKVVDSQSEDDPSEASAESDESEEEDERRPAPRSAAGGRGAAAVAATSAAPARPAMPSRQSSSASQKPTTPRQRTESPDLINGSDSSSEESESEESESEASEQEEETRRPSGKKGAAPVTAKKAASKSKAAMLAAAAMDGPSNARTKKGKPLASLTYEDVALTDADMAEDISVIWKAMHLFMNSRMIEAEDICLSAADHRLYYSVGYSLIQVIKSLATFEPEDLEAAIQCCKDSILITQLLRKKDHSIFEKVGGIAKGSTSVASIKSMTVVQRHAELIFAECTLLKAVIGIIYSGDFIAFLKEALNMRNAYFIYRTLAKFVEAADAANGGREDPKIDQDFRSGVFLGNGMISLILSLLPATVLKMMSIFGVEGDREYALATLMKGGKWKAGVKEPGMPVESEGIRRQVCDMVLLTHHLVIASYLPVGGVDIPTASNVLHYNLDRYPNGIFFLYFGGRLHSTETQLEDAVVSFHKAIQAQREYIQLGHICYWDLGLVSLAMGNYVKGYECFNILDKESNWSKAIYAYAKATTLYEEGRDISRANSIMANVPDLMQRIAGKSIPLEKFVARRARKFTTQGNRLMLPGIELAYVLNCLGLSPRFVLFDVHLDQVSSALAELHKVKNPKDWGKGDEFWDDYCLAHLLRGIILRFIAHPESHTKPRPAKSPIPVKEADEQAMISFNNILKHGRDIVHDHHLVWFAHYELGRLYDAMKDYPQAKVQYDIVMSGKNMEIAGKKGNHKVSLQNMAVLRSNSALQVLRDDRKI